MDPSKDQEFAEEEKELERANGYGRKKYGRLVRMFREGFISVAIYKNVFEKRTFFDIVIYRKIRVGDGYDYRRGANLKPADIPALIILLREVDDHLRALETSAE